jgi:bacteriocin biosynthesis cyclodehydratase domain-containing protein
MRLDLPSDERALKLLDVQVARFEDGMVLKRGLSRVFLEAPGIEELLGRLVEEVRVEGGATPSRMVESVDEEQRETMRSLIAALETRRFLVPADEDGGDADSNVHEQVFYWIFGASAAEVRARLEKAQIAVIGVNHVGATLAQARVRLGFHGTSLINHPLLRNVSLDPDDYGATDYASWAEIDDLPDCLVVTTDFGGPSLMQEWNAFCVENDVPFLPVLLHDHTGLVGPLVLPGRSACYECAARRERGVATDFDLRRATDSEGYFAQNSVGHLAPMGETVANFAALELLKYYSQALPGGNVGRLIEIDLLAPSVSSRRVLKLPRCPVCSTLRRMPTVAADANVFMPGNE